MQNITDAGLVPDRKQNTIGIETGLTEFKKIRTFRQDTTRNGQIFINSENSSPYYTLDVIFTNVHE